MKAIITLPELQASKVFVKEGANVKFGSPNEYLSPFMDVLPADKVDYRVEVADPVTNAEESGERNTAYPRVHLQAEFHNGVPKGFKSVMGILYALDVQKPVMKVYTGLNVSVCMNLTIFNSAEVYQQEILSANYKEVYNKAKAYVDIKAKQIKEYVALVKKLDETHLTEASLNETVGKLLRNGQVTRLGSTAVVQAVRMMSTSGSPYYVYYNNEFKCSLWNVYNAVTDVLTHGSEFVDRANKITILSKILMN